MNRKTVAAWTIASFLQSLNMGGKPLPRRRKSSATKPSIEARVKRRRRRKKIANVSRKRNRGNS